MSGVAPALLFALLAMPAWAAGSGVVGENLLWLALILMSARLFAPLAQRIGFPAVLGELLLGVLLGNLALFGFHYFDQIARDPIIAFMAELGVARGVKALRGGGHPLPAVDVEKALAWVEGKMGIEFAERQRDAVRQAVTQKVSVNVGQELFDARLAIGGVRDKIVVHCDGKQVVTSLPPAEKYPGAFMVLDTGVAYERYFSEADLSSAAWVLAA